jgi:hypothetical protein
MSEPGTEPFVALGHNAHRSRGKPGGRAALAVASLMHESRTLLEVGTAKKVTRSTVDVIASDRRSSPSLTLS